MNEVRVFSRRWLVLLLVIATCASAAHAEWKIESKDGDTSIKFGFLAQLRADAVDRPDGETARDIYFRRLRLLLGGKLGKKWSFFIETDSPNLGKGEGDGSKSSSDIFIQDAFFTYSHSNAFKIDMGQILIPLSHNSQQSAATLLPVDYAPFSFLNSGPTDSRVGRDYGVQFRGFLANDHFEYRAGIFQGNRGVDSTNGFRYVGRAVFYPFEADKGFYYAGTTLGKKQILALGAGYETQEEYRAYSADVFYDQPIGDGNGLTLQAGFYHYDGDVIFPELPEQDALQFELGYYIGSVKLMPFVTYYERDFEDPELVDQSGSIFQIGLGYYMKGFNRTLKASYGRIRPDVGDDRTQILVQLQLFYF
jgi:hypothetical protein